MLDPGVMEQSVDLVATQLPEQEMALEYLPLSSKVGPVMTIPHTLQRRRGHNPPTGRSCRRDEHDGRSQPAPQPSCLAN